LARDPIVTISSPAAPAGTNPATAAPLPLPEPSPAANAGDLVIAGAGPDGAASGGRARAVRRVEFENGLTLLVAENADSQVFAAHILVRDRAALEPEERDGIVDLLHRLLPYGSLFLDGEGLALKLRSLGARLKTVDDPGIPY